jgi:hypothetical protein
MAREDYTVELLSGATADGSGDWFGVRQGELFFDVTGTLDGATVALEITRDGGSTVHEVASLSAVDINIVDLPTCEVRATVSSAGASTDVTVRL